VDPDGQVRGACFARLEELDRNRSRFQAIAVEGLVTFEELEAASVDA
jgi:hypothetical protein